MDHELEQFHNSNAALDNMIGELRTKVLAHNSMNAQSILTYTEQACTHMLNSSIICARICAIKHY
jgi:hypothetical protein